MHTDTLGTLDAFLQDWTADPLNAKAAFSEYRAALAACADVSLTFKSRPGVSHSLRARHAAQHDRELFVLVDVVDDDPAERWLSVCFYDDLVTDPDDKGDMVPGGLMGEDARCFNLEADDSAMRAYIRARLEEAAANAGRGR